MPGPGQVYWVASDIRNIPPGSVVINPQTGQPISNPDGSLYHHMPGQPPTHTGQTVYTSPQYSSEVWTPGSVCNPPLYHAIPQRPSTSSRIIALYTWFLSNTLTVFNLIDSMVNDVWVYKGRSPIEILRTSVKGDICGCNISCLWRYCRFVCSSSESSLTCSLTDLP